MEESWKRPRHQDDSAEWLRKMKGNEMTELVIYQNEEELERLEGIVRVNIKSFYECGRALAEIRDKKLYCDVAGYETFEQYCKDKWDFTRNYAKRLIHSYDTIENLKNVPIGTFPETESQCRPLTKLEPEEQIEAWQRVCQIAGDGPVTALMVSRIVREMLGSQAKPEKEKELKGVSDADYFVDVAIRQVEAMRDDDPLRIKALDRLIKWAIKFKERTKP